VGCERFRSPLSSFSADTSFELADTERKVFSFQIALRSLELEPPEPSQWQPILIESLADNVGSKMNALVQRGAARDFLDIREVVIRRIAELHGPEERAEYVHRVCAAWDFGLVPVRDLEAAPFHLRRSFAAAAC
jgi:hypothetical protein